MFGQSTPGFIFGGNTGKTYEQVKSERERADMLAKRLAGSTPTTFGGGLSAIGQAIAYRHLDKKATAGEEKGRSAFNEQFSNTFGGGSQAPMGAPTPMPSPAGGPSPMPAGGGAQGGNPMVQNASMRADAPSGAEWLQYANQGAIRSKPLNEKLTGAMGFLGDMGITMKVISGGQDAKGSGGRRTGSTRHDHGGAADADFYMGGRKLDWNNPQDVPIFQEIVKRARANGVTGIGAGDDYMGAGRVHIGFGNEAVWGAGGKGENAPEWLRAAYGGAAATPVNQGGAPSQPAQVPQVGGANIAQMMQLAQNPYATPAQSAMMQMMIQRQMQQSDPAYQMQMEIDRMKLEQMRNPQVDPMDAIQLQKAEIELQRLQNPQPEMTDDMREYEYAKGTGFEGSFTDFMQANRRAGATNVTTTVGGQSDVGTIPQGFELVTNPETGARSMRAIPGGPEDTTQQRDVAQSNRDTSTSIITSAAQRAREAAENRAVGGVFGSIAAMNPSSQNAEVYRQVEVLQSNAKIENLTAMRAASPTGGALGAVSDKESQMLAAKSGALDPASPTFERDLDDYERTLLQVVHGFEVGNSMFEQSRGGGVAPDQPSSQGIPPAPEGFDPQRWPQVWDAMPEEDRSLWK